MAYAAPKANYPSHHELFDLLKSREAFQDIDIVRDAFQRFRIRNIPASDHRLRESAASLGTTWVFLHVRSRHIVAFGILLMASDTRIDFAAGKQTLAWTVENSILPVPILSIETSGHFRITVNRMAASLVLSLSFAFTITVPTG